MAPSWRSVHDSNYAQINNHLDQRGYCGNTLNCYWLDENCCNQEAVNHAKTESMQWYNNGGSGYRSRLNSTLYSLGLCSAVTTTTATTEGLDCSYLPDACCSVPTLNYLSVVAASWTRSSSSEWKARLIVHLTELGYCPTPSTSTMETTTTDTTISTLDCGWLEEKCCTPEAVELANNASSNWRSVTNATRRANFHDILVARGLCDNGEC